MAEQQLIRALERAFTATFRALADMYDNRDGPWVDELRDASRTDRGPLEPRVSSLFKELRGTLNRPNL